MGRSLENQNIIKSIINQNTMKHLKQTAGIIVFLLLINGISSCTPTIVKNNDYWLAFTDTITNKSGYKDSAGKIVIPLGKYPVCATDTFRTYAIVANQTTGFVAIDRQETVLYQIFSFDNGPDVPSDGLFRIIANNKIGYADFKTGVIVIKPQFDCAWPFENGLAEVSLDCTTQLDGEHVIWQSDHWFYIDKTGKKVEKAKADK